MPDTILVVEVPQHLSHALSSFTEEALTEISAALCALLANCFALYLKTKNFHWYISGVHFRDHHLLLDEQAEEFSAITDAIAERSRKIGATTIRSIGDISRHQRLRDNDDLFVGPKDMLVELCIDNQQLTRFFRSAHVICDRNGDVAIAGLIENWIDQSERRSWFLYETVILCAIREGPVRLGRLIRELPTASKKVLTENLRELERAGLIVRRDFGEALRHVEYDFAEGLRPEMQSLLDHLASFSPAVRDPSMTKCSCASH